MRLRLFIMGSPLVFTLRSTTGHHVTFSRHCLAPRTQPVFEGAASLKWGTQPDLASAAAAAHPKVTTPPLLTSNARNEWRAGPARNPETPNP